MHRADTGSRGLTLVEIMIVVAVSSLLLSGAWRIVSQSMNTYTRSLQDIRLTQGARVTMRMMIQDLQRVSTGAAQQHVRGNNEQRVSPNGEVVDADSLTLRTWPAASEAAPLLRLSMPGLNQQVRYFLEPTTPHGPLRLQRAVSSAGDSTTKHVALLHEQVHALNVRYFDGSVWHDEWQQAGLPQAIELALIFQEGRRPSRSYRFVTIVPCEA